MDQGSWYLRCQPSRTPNYPQLGAVKMYVLIITKNHIVDVILSQKSLTIDCIVVWLSLTTWFLNSYSLSSHLVCRSSQSLVYPVRFTLDEQWHLDWILDSYYTTAYECDLYFWISRLSCFHILSCVPCHQIVCQHHSTVTEYSFTVEYSSNTKLNAYMVYQDVFLGLMIQCCWSWPNPIKTSINVVRV